MTVTVFLIRLLVLAVIFVNGWTDAPNAIATAVGSGSLTFRQGVWLAAGCNFLGAALACLLLPAATQGAAALLPSWRLVLEFSGGMLLLPALWFLGVRVLDFCSAGAGYGDGYYTIYYSRLFSLHCVIFSADKVAQVQLRQSPIQRMSGRCDVLVYTRAEGRQVHRLRNLELAAARRLFGLT